jgi:hypothetical protein
LTGCATILYCIIAAASVLNLPVTTITSAVWSVVIFGLLYYGASEGGGHVHGDAEEDPWQPSGKVVMISVRAQAAEVPRRLEKLETDRGSQICAP